MVCDGVAVDLELCDSAGEEQLKRYRSHTYYETDVFIICFSIVSPKTLQSVVNNWIPEIKEHWTNKPFILVGLRYYYWLESFEKTIYHFLGTKSDLRTNIEILRDLSENKETPVERQMGQKLAAKYGAVKYLECSAATKLGVNQLFDESIKKALEIYFGPMITSRRNCFTCNIM